jgi:SP family xylose:H+ symportor-like MFS transporter
MSDNVRLATRLTLIATLGGLLFGYDTAVISGAIGAIDANFVNPLDLSETARSSLSGFTISSALFGCVLGAAGAGWIADTLGRKIGLIVAAILFLIGAIGSAVPELGLGPIGGMGPAALVPFNIYRILGGIGVGLASLMSPLYIAEIAPPAVRGRLVSYNQMAIVLGIVGVYFINWAIARQGDQAWLLATGWRWMFASEALPALAFLALLGFAPDTPRWLVMKRRGDAALDVLRRLGDGTAPAETLAEIEASLTGRSDRLLAFGPLLIVVGLMLSIFQQVVGINAVLYYAPLMFGNMGASTDSALLQTVIVGTANMLFTLLAIGVVDVIGRKPLMIGGGFAMGAAMITLGSLFASDSLGLGALIAVIVYIGAFACSWGPVTWVLLSEIFPNSIKAKAMAVAVAAQWLANLAVSWSFKVIDGNSGLNAVFHHGFAYWIYGIMSILGALFVWRFVPETKGRSLEAMEHLWIAKPPGGTTLAGDGAV